MFLTQAQLVQPSKLSEYYLNIMAQNKSKRLQNAFMASSTAQKAWGQAEQLTQSRHKRDSAFERSLFGETGSILAQSPLRDTVFMFIATHRDNNLQHIQFQQRKVKIL